MSIYENKRILVTGGSGSIGSEITRQLLKYNPEEIRIFNRSEKNLVELQREMKDVAKLTFRIGDIRDELRLSEVMSDIDIVFHAAAMKHVDICEYNPREAIKTNVIGTENIIQHSLDNDVEKVIILSTDKATNPTNTMGATKLLAERLMAEADANKTDHKTIFCAVRFGNVLGSAGSVVPLFKKMIKENKNLKITNEEMTRFVMTIPESANLVLEAGEIAQGGETFVLKMNSLKLGDLADSMIDLTSQKYGYNIQEISKDVIGLRPGEKIHEDLITETEWARTLETSKLYIIKSPIDPKQKDYTGAKKPETYNYNSQHSRLLTKDEIKNLLQKENMV